MVGNLKAIARGRSVAASPPAWDSLTGKFFHELCSGGRYSRQGMVVCERADGLLAVQYFSWLTTERDWSVCLISMADVDWRRYRFYGTDDEMRDAHEYSGIWPHGERYGECACQKAGKAGIPE